MPEYPDLTVYVEALRERLLGDTLEAVHLLHPFLLRTVAPQPGEGIGRRVVGVCRIGKRIAIELEGELFFVIHLMIAGRLQWLAPDARLPRKRGLATFAFAGPVPGTLGLTEASTKKRASLHVIAGALRQFDRGGVEPFECGLEEFTAALTAERHTLKRALTDPRIVAGIGNAYSDEILHRACLSPFRPTSALKAEELERLFEACRTVLSEWTERLRAESRGTFPSRVTAFHREMAVHGKFDHPCPVCGTPVQRIAYAENESNYCPRCQTGGKLLADRALSRLLKDDWPATVEELEALHHSAERQSPPS